jgi:putative Mg2+ transporter-C (MgtC) family protein
MALVEGATTGQTWAQVGELGLAFLLSALIGLEREIRGKSAGLRTLTIVGFASALFVQIGKYGFFDVVGPNIRPDPAHVAGQIVTGLGFLGAGLIFVRRDAVRGLTTAAVVWLTAAVGMAAGAGLWLLAVVGAAGHLVATFGLTTVSHRVRRRLGARHGLRLTYRDGEGVLRRALGVCTDRGFVVREVDTEGGEPPPREESDGVRQVSVRLTVEGRGSIAELAAALADLDGVLAVRGGDVDDEAE